MIHLTKEMVSEYRAAALRGQEERIEGLAPMRDHAWVAARRAAEFLRQKFHATRVVVFGSLVRPECFTVWSDIDIAAWDIAPEETFHAISTILDIDKAFNINLVDVNACRPSILKRILQEGIEI